MVQFENCVLVDLTLRTTKILKFHQIWYMTHVSDKDIIQSYVFQ
jgi:hypothetical protein